jgi:hypothetical protein
MRRIAYADNHFVTTDAVAAKVLDYARVMGNVATDDVVHLPTVGEDGQVRSVDMLLGPASQITAEEIEGPELDLGADALLLDLERRIALLRTPHAAVDDEADLTGYDPELDS